MSLNYADLLTKSDPELIAEHDALAQHTAVGVDYYLAELRRRPLDRSTQAILRLTVANTVLSVIAIVVATVSLLIR